MRLSPVKPFQILVVANVLVVILVFVWMIRIFWFEEVFVVDLPNDSPGNASFPAVIIETSAVKAHPLFSKNRLPVPERPHTEEGEEKKLSPPPLIVGILGGTKGNVGAFVEDLQTGDRKFVRDGGEFMGWKLIAIRPKVVILRHGENRTEVPLSFDPRTPLKAPNSDPNFKAP